MGLDASPGYNVGTLKPNMPNLQNLINSGITFNNVWSNPVCSPTRSTILTGKYGYRTNVLDAGDNLSIQETSIQTYINANSGNEYSDAVIGKSANIGAGTITCNYDGKKKNKTQISDGAFIGSNTALIAPIKIGKKAIVGAGSALTKNVKNKSLALTRSNQIEIKNYKRK